MAVRLVAVEGLDEGRIYDVSERGIFVFGREGVVLTRSGEPPKDGFTSRFHAAIEVAASTVTVSDMGSKNKTWLNGRALARFKAQPLRNGDRLKMGRTILRVDIDETSTPTLDRERPAPATPSAPSVSPRPFVSRFFPSRPVTPLRSAPAADPDAARPPPDATVRRADLPAPAAPPSHPAPPHEPSPPPAEPDDAPAGATTHGKRRTPDASAGPLPAAPAPSDPLPSTPQDGALSPAPVVSPVPSASSSPPSPLPPARADDTPVAPAPRREVDFEISIVGEGSPPRVVDSERTRPRVRAGSSPEPSGGPASPAARSSSPRGPRERSIDEFERGSKIGEGGHAVVYRAVDKADGRVVALKLMRASGDRPPTAASEFRREIAVHAALSDEHIVPVLAYGTDRDTPWLALEFVEGPDLEQSVEADGMLSPAEAVGVADAVLAALAYAHERRFVHRDVKPSNVLLRGRRGTCVPLLADFGLAKAWQAAGSPILTATATFKGSLAYAAPEQMKDAKGVGPPADLYGAGATLYWALTHSSHLDGPTEGLQAIDTVLSAKVVPLAKRRSGLPISLCASIDRALSRNPADRPRSADSMRKAIRGG